ncbi:unnamed protein product, partial [Ectocarpus fasciculatus]
QTKENAELRRHVKRRTQALDTIRRAYIVDVERLKRDLRDQIVHYDEKEIVKLRRQLETTREELMKSGKALGNSNAIVETYRTKAETASSEFSEINNMLLREMKVLKEKLVNAGPEIVAKVSEERDKAESRVRSANRTVSDLENVVVELQAQVQRDADDNLKVEEMEHHLQEASKETKAMAIERDTHASAADELRATVASLNTDLQQANDRNVKLLKAFEDHEENSKRSIAKLRKLLESAKTSEAEIREELAALREENLHDMLASEGDEGNTRSHEHLGRPKDAASADGSFFADFNGEPEVVPPPSEKSDKMLVLELTEGLRRKSTAAVGEEILSGAYARREEQAALEIAQLKALLTKADAQVLKGKRDNKKLLKMWNDARARLQEAEGTTRSGDCSNLSLPITVSTVATEEHPPAEEVKESAANLRSGKRARRSTRKADTVDSSDEDDAEDVMSVAIMILQEDCRRLGVAKGELQEHCNNLQSQLNSLQESLAKTQSSLESERQGKEEAERELEERRELLSKATLAVAEHSMALHDAQEGTDRVKQELDQEKAATTQLGLQLKEMDTVNSVLEAGLVATKNSLEIMTTAKDEAEAAAERNASQAKRNALRAEGNASWAEAEGMRAEEESSRRFLSDVAAVERIAVLGVELNKCVNELKRRRLEAKEHAEQMKEFRQVVAERAKLEEEVASQRDTILDMRQRTAKDQTMIEELKLQVVLLDGMRKEVLSLEDKVERLQVELGVTKTSLEASNQQRKVQIATVEHHDRVDGARSDQLLLDSVCKQRAAQISNMEEAMRKLEATRVALQKEHDEVLVEKEELHETVLKQNEVLLDNSKELRKYSALKVDHAAEVRQHGKVARCLQEAEGNIRRVNIRLERAIGDAAVAASTAKEAESVRASAVEEREAAVVEAQIIRDTMERGKEQAHAVEKQLHDLVEANVTRLATNTAVATEVLYGDFTHEAGTMTTFVSPELTMRQLRRLPAARGLAPESCGRVYSRLKDPGPWEDMRHKRSGCVRPYHVCDQPVRDCGKAWKQGPGAPPFTDGCGPTCG